jgi:hypothetical protein
MKKLGLFVLLAFAVAAGFAQTQFIAVYDFAIDDSNVQSFLYNGDPITGITMGPMVKQGVETVDYYPYSFYAKGWPLSTTPDLNKYMGFTMTAQPGYTFSIDRIYFNTGSFPGGTQRAQCRGSADGFANPFDSYTRSYTWGIDWELRTPTDYGHRIDRAILDLSGVAGYQNTGYCDLRMYMYESMQADGKSGFWDKVMIIGTVQSTGGPSLSSTPSYFAAHNFGYALPYGTSTVKSIAVTASGLTGPLQIFGTKNYEVATDAAGPFGPTAEIPHTTGNVNQNVYVRLKAGLEWGTYHEEIVMMHSSETGYALGAICNGNVEGSWQGYVVRFEGENETKPLYDPGTVTLNGIDWDMSYANIETDPNYVISGTKSAVLLGYGQSSMTMLDDHLEGCEQVRFTHRAYGNDTQVPWVLEYCRDAGTNWIQAGTSFTASSTAKDFYVNLKLTGHIRFRIRRETPDASTDNHRIIIDDFTTGCAHDIFHSGSVPPIQEHYFEGGPASINRRATPSVIPNAEPQEIIMHLCLIVHGTGGSGFNVYADYIPYPDGWIGFKQAGQWYFFDYSEGSIFLSFYELRSMEIEVAAGYGGRPDTVPVTLSHFSAAMTAENYVQLTWISQTETNVLGYNVYRSADNNLSSAMQICPMIAATNTSQSQTYIHVDKDLVEDGTYYYWLQNVDLDGTTGFHGPASVIFTITGEDGSPAIPKVTKLEDAYPNPFNPNTTIRYQLESPGKVRIDIYNQRGQLVRSFENSHDAAGYYSILWDGCDGSGRALASGVYLYRMTSGQYSGVKKMVLQK